MLALITDGSPIDRIHRGPFCRILKYLMHSLANQRFLGRKNATWKVVFLAAWGLFSSVALGQSDGFRAMGPDERRGNDAWRSDMRESLLNNDRATPPPAYGKRRMSPEERQALREAVRDAYGDRQLRARRRP